MEMGFWAETPFDKARAWVDLQLLATHRDEQSVYRGRMIVFHRGEVNRSVTWLAERWGWCRKTVTNFLLDLQKHGLVRYDANSVRTTIYLTHYDQEQDGDETGSWFAAEVTGDFAGDVSGDVATEVAAEVSAGVAAEVAHTRRLKNIKNVNNVKNVNKNKGTMVPPTLEEVTAYIQENGKKVDPVRFFNYYESTGWMVGRHQMKNWHAAVATWEQRENIHPVQQVPPVVQAPMARKNPAANFSQRDWSSDHMDDVDESYERAGRLLAEMKKQKKE